MLNHTAPTYLLWETCKGLGVSTTENGKYAQCSIGSGHLGFCPAPLLQREYYFKALIGFDNPRETPIRDFIDHSLHKNQTLIFIGDSLMHQTFDAFRCEAIREGLEVAVQLPHPLHNILPIQ
jgi:hypothetical protein